MRWVLLLIILFLPATSWAAISISEVAWMGSAESANYEWIELYNDGSATDVTDWTLSDGVNLVIELSGVVPAGAYVVLERTSEASAAGSAFMIYTGALVNSGATLKLKNNVGNLVDQVSGGEDWQNIGGDNITKETAQYTSLGWVTAVATPGRGISNSEADAGKEESVVDTDTTADESYSSGTTKNKSGGEAVRLILPDVSLQLTVDAQSVGYVNQLIDFSVEATGIGKHLIDSLVYQWNFGDGLQGSGVEDKHIFTYPGTYVVTVYGLYKRQEQVARHEITILPVTISLTTSKNGDIQVNNDSSYEIDISGYRIKGKKDFIFPARSILLPNQTVTIAKNKVGEVTQQVVMFYDNEKSLLASLLPDSLSPKLLVEPVDLSPTPRINALSFSAPKENNFVPADNFRFVTAPDVNKEKPAVVKKTVILESADKPASTSVLTASAVGSGVVVGERWTYLALIIVLLLGMLGVYISSGRD